MEEIIEFYMSAGGGNGYNAFMAAAGTLGAMLVLPLCILNAVRKFFNPKIDGIDLWVDIALIIIGPLLALALTGVIISFAVMTCWIWIPLWLRYKYLKTN